MNKCQISVVIPVYKVEPYLHRCVDSVLKQSFMQEYEIILVDDGSPDNCPQICDEYATQFSNIKVIHKQNGGLSSARNAGLKEATGKYIAFIDSDDWYEPYTLEALFTIAEEKKVDFVRFCPMYSGWPNHSDGEGYDDGPYRQLEDGYYDIERIRSSILPRLIATPQLTLGPIVSAWRSFYKREFLIKNNLCFYEDIKYCEDSIFSANVLLHTHSFYYIKKADYYHYYYNSTSITKSFRSDRWGSSKKLGKRFETDFIDESSYDFSNQIGLIKLFCVLNGLSQRRYINDKVQKVEYCKSICEDPFTRDAVRYIRLAEIPFKLKVYLLFIKYKQAKLVANL